jgi:excisionase family DNA binding protein
MPIILDCKPLLNDWFPGSFPKLPYIPSPAPEPLPDGLSTPEQAAKYVQCHPDTSQPLAVLPCGLLDLRNASEYLGLHPDVLRRLCKRGRIKHTRLNRTTWRFRVADLDDYLARHTFRAKPCRP